MAISRETAGDGSEKLEMKLDSPLANANHIEAEFDYNNAENKVDFELKSDKLYLEITGWKSGFEFELESVPYDIKVSSHMVCLACLPALVPSKTRLKNPEPPQPPYPVL